MGLSIEGLCAVWAAPRPRSCSRRPARLESRWRLREHGTRRCCAARSTSSRSRGLVVGAGVLLGSGAGPRVAPRLIRARTHRHPGNPGEDVLPVRRRSHHSRRTAETVSTWTWDVPGPSAQAPPTTSRSTSAGAASAWTRLRSTRPAELGRGLAASSSTCWSPITPTPTTPSTAPNGPAFRRP